MKKECAMHTPIFFWKINLLFIIFFIMISSISIHAQQSKMESQCAAIMEQASRHKEKDREEKATALAQVVLNRSEKLKHHFSLICSGSLLSLKNELAQNYIPSYNFTCGLGIVRTFPGNTNKIASRLHLVYSRDVFELKNLTKHFFNIKNDVFASNSGIHIEYFVDAFSLNLRNIRLAANLGSGFGGTRFSIAEQHFDKFGKSTLTELAEENQKIQFSSYYSLGLSATAFEHFSLTYFYDFMTTQKSYLFGHNVIGNIIKSASTNGVVSGLQHFLHTRVQYSKVYQFLVTCYLTATIIFWENVNKYHTNWPFRDKPLLKYNRHRFGITYYF
jgi:hypothetical protein